jgi:hypothetical protein
MMAKRPDLSRWFLGKAVPSGDGDAFPLSSVRLISGRWVYWERRPAIDLSEEETIRLWTLVNELL